MPFYPTYKEWKRNYPSGKKEKVIFLFILPMRNGNSRCSKRSLRIVILFILPMRNGNDPQALLLVHL